MEAADTVQRRFAGIYFRQNGLPAVEHSWIPLVRRPKESRMNDTDYNGRATYVLRFTL